MDFFKHDGLNLAYVDLTPEDGSRGEPILLVHGFASNHSVNWIETLWTRTLTRAGRRVVALDNRGHGESDKPRDSALYALPKMAADARALLDHLAIERADVMGYSMGARIAAFLALSRPERVRSAVLGGLGQHLITQSGLAPSIADAMEAPSLDDLVDPTQRMFRAFAQATRSDLPALAACIRGARQIMSAEEFGGIACPMLVAIGSADAIAGDPHALAALNPRAQALEIPGRDHNRAVGDRVFKEGVLAFLAERP